MDGIGLNPNPLANAVAIAKKPNIDRLLSTCPNSTLTTFGEEVGLPAGQMGNSEVGHLNIGAGRVIEQSLLRISRALESNFLDSSPEYGSFIRSVAESRTIHIIGLLSSGGVHSQTEHLRLLLPRLTKDFPGKIALHLISDGRDVSPSSFITDLTDIQAFIAKMPQISIASVVGRFFAMDRDQRWERVEKAYRAIALAEGALATSLSGAVQDSYAAKVSDEFLEPLIGTAAPFQEGDGALFWNFREDRMREIVASLCVQDFAPFSRSAPIPARERVLCFTEYDATFGLPFIFGPLDITNHLGDVISQAGLKQLRIAETEKYPHVTYFLNGGIEAPVIGEVREMVPSPRDVKTYDLKPEMSAEGVKDHVVKGIQSDQYALIVVNFANGDMVGHTGNLEAAIKAVETVDSCIGQIVAALERVGGQAVFLADHGNCEQMIHYEDGTPHTAHTTYPVPIIIFGSQGSLRNGGALCDVAPTVLKMMGLAQPKEMTGRSLFEE